MAYFPNKTKVKQELQEQSNKFDLSCIHLTTAKFFEPNVAYVRDNTTKESWKSNDGVFARPLPLQLPVMGNATLNLKTYFIPYRVLTPQWYNFYTRTPHMPANGTTPILVQEMPYYKNYTLVRLFKEPGYSNPITDQTSNVYDFKTNNGEKRNYTAFGRHCMKILNQLRYVILWGGTDKDEKHYNALRILAFAKAYLDFYYSSQYQLLTAESYAVEQLFKKDDTNTYELNQADFDNIFKLTRYTWYEEDYFISQWDNPTSPNIAQTSFGNITLPDITITGTEAVQGYVTNQRTGDFNNAYTPYLNPAENTKDQGINAITQYALDSLKRCTDMVKRYALAGARSIDRYLARFGVLLTAEKLTRSEYYGEQITQMQFGAVMSTAETNDAAIGDYAGQGIINSDGQQHNEFQLQDMKDLGCIMQIFTITPKIGYFQGMARENLRSDPESYFNGQFDGMGTQATSAAEIYISNDGQSSYATEDHVNNIFGYISRQAHMKLALDNLTGDFRFPSLNYGTMFSPWHMFRVFDDKFFNDNYGVVHSPAFTRAIDAQQYERIFNSTDDTGDKLVVLLQFKVESMMHAKPVYDTYDFEGEGKEIILDGLGPKQI